MTTQSLKVEFTDEDFRFIQQLVATHAGINLTERKRELVYGRLWKRIRELRLESFREYCNLLKKADPEEIAHCINAITTNVTSFFRESHHFYFLMDWLRGRARDPNPAKRKVRIWSAGCSSGEEPYSIAISILLAGVDLSDWDIEILASDIDSEVLKKATAGIYKMDRISGLNDAQRKFFQRGTGDNEGLVRINPKLREMITFKPINLLGTWTTGQESFDLIFCRNVIIYFTVEDRQRLLQRFADQLKPGGYLILGHSESVHGVDNRYKVAGQTINQRL